MYSLFIQLHFFTLVCIHSKTKCSILIMDDLCVESEILVLLNLRWHLCLITKCDFNALVF